MVTQEELRVLLDYEPETGEFKWALSLSNRAPIGKVAGYTTDNGYIKISVNNREYPAHRLAWVLMYGSIPDSKQIDHINGDRSDNRISNLRVVSNRQNSMNTRMKSSNTSGYCGVYWDKKRKMWKAGIKVNYKQILIGHFNDIESAAMARSEYNIIHGFHQNHGLPEDQRTKETK